jgi:hypothetical protein
MATLVSAYADGGLRGLARWYTRFHISGCPRCKAALEALKQLKDRLRSLTSPAGSIADSRLSGERWNRLDSAWEKAEKDGS